MIVTKKLSVTGAMKKVPARHNIPRNASMKIGKLFGQSLSKSDDAEDDVNQNKLVAEEYEAGKENRISMYTIENQGEESKFVDVQDERDDVYSYNKNRKEEEEQKELYSNMVEEEIKLRRSIYSILQLKLIKASSADTNTEMKESSDDHVCSSTKQEKERVERNNEEEEQEGLGCTPSGRESTDDEEKADQEIEGEKEKKEEIAAGEQVGMEAGETKVEKEELSSKLTKNGRQKEEKSKNGLLPSTTEGEKQERVECSAEKQEKTIRNHSESPKKEEKAIETIKNKEQEEPLKKVDLQVMKHKTKDKLSDEASVQTFLTSGTKILKDLFSLEQSLSAEKKNQDEGEKDTEPTCAPLKETPVTLETPSAFVRSSEIVQGRFTPSPPSITPSEITHLRLPLSPPSRTPSEITHLRLSPPSVAPSEITHLRLPASPPSVASSTQKFSTISQLFPPIDNKYDLAAEEIAKQQEDGLMSNTIISNVVFGIATGFESILLATDSILFGTAERLNDVTKKARLIMERSRTTEPSVDTMADTLTEPSVDTMADTLTDT